MTFIQPNKRNSILNIVLVMLVVAVVAGTFGMVALYNMTVNLSYNISLAKTQLDTLGAQSTNLNNQVLADLSGNALTSLATQDGLVTDNTPQYFQVNQQWPIASQL